MLINIDPLLNGELLYALRSMGHGDELALVDVNFPAESVAADTAMGSPIRLDGTDIISAAKAIFSVASSIFFLGRSILEALYTIFHLIRPL